jgi:hypothetical protein
MSTNQKHSLFSLGNLVEGIHDVVSSLKDEIQYLKGEIEFIHTGTPNPYTISLVPSDTTTTSPS